MLAFLLVIVILKIAVLCLRSILALILVLSFRPLNLIGGLEKEN
jgi:hypothetical protein